MPKRPALLLGLVLLLLIVASFASFKYGELKSKPTDADTALEEKLSAAFAIQSVKLLLKANQEMSSGNLHESRETLITHLGDSLYFVGSGLSSGDKAYADIASSLCSRSEQIGSVIASLSQQKPTDDDRVRSNREARKKLFEKGLAEIERHCAAASAKQ